MTIDCIYCDPNCFVVYGYCKVCGRMCAPPLITLEKVSPQDAKELIRNWNKKKEDPDHLLFSVIEL